MSDRDKSPRIAAEYKRHPDHPQQNDPDVLFFVKKVFDVMF